MPGARRLGRFHLQRLLGKTSRSMLWLADDPSSGLRLHLMLPRSQPPDAAALQAWLRGARHAARLAHPQLVPAVEIGVEAHWPYVASAAAAGVPLDEQLQRERPSPEQAARWLAELLQGLAYAHEAGVAHGDIAGHSVLVDAQGRALLVGLGCEGALAAGAAAGGSALAVDPDALRVQRAASERDVLACGLLLHRLLAGRPAFDEKDAPTAVERIGREIARLGWNVPQPVPDALRAIANRATEREPRLRYLGARSLQRALQGWLEAQAAGGEGVLALLLERLTRVGHLPALPGLSRRVGALSAMEQQRMTELSDVILQDPALAFELLRQVNGAQFAAHAEGGVSTVRRAVQLIGMQGLQHAANGLRPWPGPLGEAAAAALAARLREALLSAHVARSLCPADMDGEAAFLVALLQHLGWLLACYHFPEEAEQIRRLLEPVAEAGAKRAPMDEATAACAVMGVELEALAAAVARHWGLDEQMLAAMRRLPPGAPLRAPESRNEMLRLLGVAAAEAVAALSAPEARTADGAAAALARVTQRHARPLFLGPNELQSALQAARLAVAEAEDAR